MKASWSKISAAAASCLLLLAFTYGCSGAPDPKPMDLESSGSSGKDPEQSGTVPPDEPASHGPDVEPVEVCGEVTTDEVRKALGLGADASVQGDDISPEPAEEMAASFSCRYSWGDNPLTERVTVSVVPKTGNKDVQQAFAEVIGEDPKAYDGVGDVAGFDRGRFGPKTLAFAAVTETSEGSSSVMVLGYEKASPDDYAALAEELLNALP